MKRTLRTTRPSGKKDYLTLSASQLTSHDKVTLGSKTTRSQSYRASRSHDITLQRWLKRLRTALATLTRPERRVAIERLPPRARSALLNYMETSLQEAAAAASSALPEVSKLDPPSIPRLGVQINARHSVNSNATHFGCCCSRRRPQVPVEVAVSVGHRGSYRRGVRAVPTGLFQASVSFDHLLVRSSTSRSRAGALRHLLVLRRFKELAMSQRGCEEDRICEAYAEALTEANLSEEALRPSYCAYVSLGARAGKVESPTTANLQQALAWRRCLLSAYSKGLSPLRAVWVEMLQEERTGHSVRLSASAAEARADSLFRRCQNALVSYPAGLRPLATKRRKKKEMVDRPPKAEARVTRAKMAAQRARDRMRSRAEASVVRAAAKITFLTKRLKSPRRLPAVHVTPTVR